MLRKSVWIYPFDGAEQVQLLKQLFDLTDLELRVVMSESIGEDTQYRKHFKLS